ncbi:MAG: sigma-54-dependent transcriptional regulator [Verrucomicrobiota bacterium]
MNTPARLLLIEDDPGAAQSLQRLLAAEGYDVELASDGRSGLEAARDPGFEVVITDGRMPGADGLEVVGALNARRPELPVILITAHGSTDTAIEATKRGAFEYLVKPLDMEELLAVTARAVAHRRRLGGVAEASPAGAEEDGMVGRSRLMRDIYKEIGRVAARPVDVLIRGETGTGKELVARAIYRHSDRSGGPFIPVNCAAIPENLLESELFGHERGAFTGAGSRRIGRFEQAAGGTIFLDEIGDLTQFTQAKLLRVLQERVITRVGGDAPIRVDVRVLAATHQNLEAMIVERLFREDLLYRLSQFTINLPPLRQRAEDIRDLAGHFARRMGAELGIYQPSFSPAAVDLLQAQPWPGNIRQLANFVRECLLLARGPVGVEHVRLGLFKADRAAAAAPVDPLGQLARQLLAEARETGRSEAYRRLVGQAEKALLRVAMEQAGGNKTQAAQWLGITRFTLREKLQEHGLNPEPG